LVEHLEVENPDWCPQRLKTVPRLQHMVQRSFLLVLRAQELCQRVVCQRMLRLQL